MTVQEFIKLKLEFDAKEEQYEKARTAFIKEHGTGVFETKNIVMTVTECERNNVGYKKIVEDNLPNIPLGPYTTKTSYNEIRLKPKA